MNIFFGTDGEILASLHRLSGENERQAPKDLVPGSCMLAVSANAVECQEMVGAKMAEITGSDSADIVEVLRTLMINHSLPLWSGEGWDQVAGGFVEKLDSEGRADRAVPRRVRIKARQINSFAKAAELGWYPQGRYIALKGLQYLLAKAKGPDGRPGFVHVLEADGTVRDPLRDTYDRAFVLLAFAVVYRLSRDAQVRAELDSVVVFIDGGLRSPHGGFIKVVPATLPRRQNPQTHLFEAMIAAFDATSDLTFQTRAGDLYGLFVASLFDPQRQILGEYFEEDWSRIEPVQVEPGHQAEWVWLLRGFERITSCPTARHRSPSLASALPIATMRRAAWR